MGLEYNTKHGIRLNGLYFNRKEDHTIIYTTAYENASDGATVHGFEAEANITFVKSVLLTANYAFTYIKDGVRLRVPKHKVNAGLGYQICENQYASLSYQFVGTRMDTDFSTYQNVKLGAFSLVDLYFSHKLIKHKVKVFASITNIFNEDYFEIIGFSTKGRNVNLGLNINL